VKKHCLLMTFPSLPMNIGICIPHTAYHVYRMPCLTSWRVYAERKSLTVNTQKTEVMCFNYKSENLSPLYFDGVLLPYTDSFTYLGMMCDKQINLNTAADATLCPFTARTSRVKDFVQKHNFANRLHAYVHMDSQDMHTLFLVCLRVRFGPLLTHNKANRWKVPYRNGCWQC
jgi:hypothetical protein